MSQLVSFHSLTSNGIDVFPRIATFGMLFLFEVKQERNLDVIRSYHYEIIAKNLLGVPA